MTKRYQIDSTIQFSDIVHAKSKKDAIKQLQERMRQENNLDLEECEIDSVELA